MNAVPEATAIMIQRAQRKLSFNHLAADLLSNHWWSDTGIRIGAVPVLARPIKRVAMYRKRADLYARVLERLQGRLAQYTLNS